MKKLPSIKDKLTETALDSILIPVAEYAALKEVDRINRERVAE